MEYKLELSFSRDEMSQWLTETGRWVITTEKREFIESDEMCIETNVIRPVSVIYSAENGVIMHEIHCTDESSYRSKTSLLEEIFTKELKKLILSNK